MNCQACARLLAAYKHTVSLYTASVSEIETLDGDNVCVPCQKTKSLRQARRHRHKAWIAGDALMAHWREDHDRPAKTLLGNAVSLIFKEAERQRQSLSHADDALIAHWQRDAEMFRRASPPTPKGSPVDHVKLHGSMAIGVGVPGHAWSESSINANAPH